MSSNPYCPRGTPEEREQILNRLERVRAEVALLSPEARAGLRAFEEALDEFHREGISRMVLGFESSPHGLQILLSLTDDPAIHALLARYGVTRPDLRTRARAVLDTFEPYLAAIPAAAELIEASRDRILVRLHAPGAAFDGPASAVREQIEHALRNQLLECKAVEVAPHVVPLTSPAKSVSTEQPSLHLASTIPLSGGAPRIEPGWALGPLECEVAEGVPCRVDTGTVSALLVRWKGQLHVYLNECAHLGLPLDSGQVDGKTGVLTCPWHGFRYECATGKCVTAPGAKLDTIPFRVEQGFVLVKLT